MNARTKSYKWVSADIDKGLLLAVAQNMVASGTSYGWGAKAHPLSVDSHAFRGIDMHGHVANWVDCSGATRYILNKCGLLIPDGSVNQHEWFERQGFKPCAKSDLGNADGRVRIAFLAPHDTPSGVGHVMLLPGDGSTVESHGGKGMDRRKWLAQGWMKRCTGYVIDPRVV